jgi:hypothetical protein
MNIELRLLKDVVPYAKNLRKIPQRAIDKVALSIAEFGPRQPIVVDEAGVIIVGTVRYLAAKKNGLESFPVHIAEGLTPAQVREYRVMDNRSHQETDWDLDIVKLEMIELEALKCDLTFTGFEPREIDEFLTGGVDDQAANEAPGSSHEAGLAARRLMALRSPSGARWRRDKPGTRDACSGRFATAIDDCRCAIWRIP